MRQLIEVNIAERRRQEVSDEAYNEAIQHAVFGRSKCQTFHGREEILAVRHSLRHSLRQQSELIYLQCVRCCALYASNVYDVVFCMRVMCVMLCFVFE